MNEFMSNYTKFKGTYYSYHETLINKDLCSFKLEQIKKVMAHIEENMKLLPKQKEQAAKEEANI